MPKRIQMTRQRPWRADNPYAVIVDRTTIWGNPFLVVAGGRSPEDAVAAFRQWLSSPRIVLIRTELRGRDLACWCPLDQPCHADVLLDLANGEQS